MRQIRLVASAVILIAATVFIASRSDDDAYRVDAIFDTARGMVPGQLVKIAGAKVGTLEEVHVINGRKARLTLRIDREFEPFHRDTTCQILPEGFISENYVQCDPGSPDAPTLRAVGDAVRPTVPLDNTSVPVQLQQVIDTFSMPVNQRIRTVLSEIGIAFAGRGEDVNRLIRRANPALRDAHKALSVVSQQRDAVGEAIDRTDRILREVRQGDRHLRRFVAAVAGLTKQTSTRQDAIERTVRRLPALLDEVDAALGSIDLVSAALAPTARSLQKSAPGLAAASESLVRFAKSADPGVRALGKGVHRTQPALGSTIPAARQLERAVVNGRNSLAQSSRFMTHLRDAGGVDELFNSIYGLTTFSSAFDGVSHMVGVNVNASPQCLLDRTRPGCSHQYFAPGSGRIPINDASRSVPTTVEFPQIGPGEVRRSAPNDQVASRSRGARNPSSSGNTSEVTGSGAVVPEELNSQIQTMLRTLLR